MRFMVFKRIDTLRSFCFAVLAFFSMTMTAYALDFDVRTSSDVSKSERSAEIFMRGEIISGDVDRLKSILADFPSRSFKFVSFILDSPGGSLMEGLELGKTISQMDEFTKTVVGTNTGKQEICASACVFVYLGADFRYLGDNGRIGIHQFNDLKSKLKGHEGIALSQEIMSELLTYITSREVNTAFLERMGKTGIEQIDWVPAELLREWKVVTGDVVKENSIYSNANGKLTLTMVQLSVTGNNGISFACARDMVYAIAFFDDPGFEGVGSFFLTIDEVEHNIKDFRVANDPNGKTPVAFFIPHHLALATANAGSLGTRIASHNALTDFSYKQSILDEKLKKFIIECVPELKASSTPSSTASVWKSMTQHPNTDFVGSDLTRNGVKNVSFNECQEICNEAVECKAVSYMVDKRWCWLKSSSQKKRTANGVISATK
jgi:hypothetical protein